MTLALFAHMLCLPTVLQLVVSYTRAKSVFQPLVCVRLQQRSVKRRSQKSQTAVSRF